jgi:hypothetical protein
MTKSTIPTAAKRKEIVRHGPSSLCLRTALVHSQWDRPKGGELQFLAITQAGKVVIDRVSLYVLVIRVRDAAEDSWFSLGDPSL